MNSSKVDASNYKMTSRSDECAIEIPFTCQDEISNYRISRCLTDGNRCPSQSSSLNSNAADICRICHCEGSPDLPLITPCYCAGSLRYVHQTCLQQWIKSSNIKSCELCKFQFIMQTKVKPFSEWEYLEMSGLERKKLACAMLFHIIAMTCVCWSLYVLIDRTMDEVYKGHLEWPFWTKLIVVGIGFMGGIVFMYIQCRAYFVLCKRWKAYNRVIYVQNAPEKLTSKYAKQNGVAVTTSPESGSGPSCSFKTSFSDPHKRGGGGLHETNCIDIKGVRNLHIFFGSENQIRVHRNDRMAGETGALAHEELGRDGSKGSAAEKYGNASLHIQIGGGGSVGDRGGGTNGCRIGGGGGGGPPSSSGGCEPKMGGALRPADCPSMAESSAAAVGKGGGICGDMCAAVAATADEFKGDQSSSSSVVKLQIKKAGIVIEFGGKHGDDEPMKTAERALSRGQQPQTLDCVDGCDAAYSPRRKFSSEEYLDSETKYAGEKIANEAHESPTSQLLVSHRSCKVPFNNFFKERTSLKDWKSSEDLLDARTSVPKF